MKPEQIKEITEKASQQLVAALNAGPSDALASYLKAIARFHRYSLHNVLLITLQKPNASHVAGFRTWNQLGRFVKKGEKGILILAPMLRRKPDTADDSSTDPSIIMGFRTAYVFDISQTDGRDLPQSGACTASHEKTSSGFVGLPPRRISRSSIRNSSHQRAALLTADESRCFEASRRQKSSQRLCMNWHMNSCTEATAARARPARFAKPKPKRLPSSFAMPSGSTPDRQPVITSSSGTETWTRSPKV